MNKLAIFSVPRSGSTWLGQIFNSSPNVLYRFQPNFAYSFEHSLKETSSREEINEFYKALIDSKDDFVNAQISISSQKNVQFEKNSLATLVFKETHYINVIENLLLNSETKIIGLVRSPGAVINSWRKLPKEFDPSWVLADEWRKAEKKNNGKDYNFFGFDKWLEAYKIFHDMKKKYSDRFYILNYNDLINNPIDVTQKLFQFSEIPLKKQTIDFLNQSTSSNQEDAYGVFKEKTNDNSWKKELDPIIKKEIEQDLKENHITQF